MVNIDNINPDVIMGYLKSGNSNALTPAVVAYIDLLELIRSMYDKYETKSEIINLLMSPTYGLSRYKANILFSDALNFFYADNKVKVEAWRNICAKKADDLYQLAIAADDIETARKCLRDFANYKGLNRELPPEIPREMYIRPVVVYTMNPEDVGLQKTDRRELAAMIDSLTEISEGQRDKVKREAMVKQIDIEEDLNSYTDYEEVKGK